ncbi:hypothetical protein [uncultured Senegalimassilia sp.]|uniref:hypothetical protein n=1 Tax=uncultured Senegalimassilia sp. TaxID=1714350 RepID=UPI0025FA9DB0|nr:hypothetical protein [uncultured Senegalimassilia sp.]
MTHRTTRFCRNKPEESASSHLAPDKCRDIAMAGHVVMADLQQREEQERLSTLAQLRPIDR